MRALTRFAATTRLLALCAALTWSPALAQLEGNLEGDMLRNAQMMRELVRARAHRLSTSAGPDPDTVFVGKSSTNHTGPDNYWNLHVGTYRPGTNNAANAVWDWDNSTGIQAADSLHGWWPMRRQYNATASLTFTDDQRPWWALDHGNIANYVISQQSSAKRTFGVVGIWHADPGGPGNGVFWTPLTGTRSAWCGLRQHGDVSVMDQVTKNPFNQDVVAGLHDATFAGGGSGHNFPGYPDQIDQMLYRDIAMTPAQSLTVSFSYRTRMSTSINTTAATRTGWFHGDPLAVTAGNFISSSAAGTNAPQDSFMVYVGAPVDDAAVVYSDGVTRPVYDKQRRWFSEVLKVFGAGSDYYEIFTATGNNPADTLAATPTSGTITIPAAKVSTILGGVSGNVRLVFRCKTNRGFADSDTRTSSYTSRGRGAVQVDDVTIDIGAGPVVIGDFETAEQGGVNAIDNRIPLPPGLTATDVWRSTGKPPGEYIHAEALANLVYSDLCGPPNSPKRNCNIGGVVLTVGNHDDGENAGDTRFAAFREISQYVVSPTINLLPAAGGAANSMGISNTIRNASDDWILFYDIYAGMFDLAFSGQSWVYGMQSYPAQQPNGAEVWGQPMFPSFINMNPEPQCFTDVEGLVDNGTPFLTSRPGGIPDSLRIFLAHQQQCFRFSITLGCNSNEGGYFDNVSFAFVDIPGVPGQASATSAVNLGTVTADIWHFFQDTFPANETPGLPGTAAFDTTAAHVKTGLNTAQLTGNALRFDLPGDSLVVRAENPTVSFPDDPALAFCRVDLVFRILPGPGNYQIAAGRNMVPGGNAVTGVLLQDPTNQAAPAMPGDGSFFGQYMVDPGQVAAGTHDGPGGWDPLAWNSCRMDTLQRNLFRYSFGVTIPGGTDVFEGRYMSTIHEADPKFMTLGTNKFRCFVIDTSKAAATNTGPGGGDNVVCDGTLPAWVTTVPQSRTGWDGSATTKEFSKIIPDGLLTPGSHVQYFVRKSHSADPFLNHAMVPDTNLITPQPGEGVGGSTDKHRWQQFSVLPDRWKNLAFGGNGMACMLYVDWNDRRGNEGVFVSTMESIRATLPAKSGAHNGWSAPPTTDLDGLDVRTDMSLAVSNKNSQPGTTWDMYGVKAAESLTNSAGQLGSRFANRSNMGFAAGRESRQGPTAEMLRAYYRVVAILTGDLTSGVFGPFVNRSQNDIALLRAYLMGVGGTPMPRGIFLQGDGFAQSENKSGGIDPWHRIFLTDNLGILFRSPSYTSLSGNLDDCADLLTTSSLSNKPDIYGVANSCTWSNDVFHRNVSLPETSEGAYYENVGLEGPYVSDVVKPAAPLRNWIATTSGIDIEHLLCRDCDGFGRREEYYYYMLNQVFASICQITNFPPAFTGCPPNLDVPGSDHASFLKIGNAVMRDGSSTVRLGLAQSGRAQIRVYDVVGRKIRTLADRIFPAGEHTFVWDGRDDRGNPVGRGVYFVRSSTQEGAGRIVVLDR